MKLRTILSQVKKIKNFSYVTPFRNGYALAIKKQDNFSCGRIVKINEDYDIQYFTQYEYKYLNPNKVKWFNGYIPVTDLDSICRDSVVILDLNLKEVEGHRYHNIYFNRFEDNYAEIVIQANGTKLIGVVDENLNTILEPEAYLEIVYLDHEIFAARISNCETLIYNVLTGEKKVVEGMPIKVCTVQGKKYYKYSIHHKYGYYDEKFRVAIPPQ